MSSQRAVLFVNGAVSDPARARSLLAAEDVCIAVDGGIRHAFALGVAPAVLIGDLDSIPEGARTDPRLADTRILRFPPAKDQSDLELAFDFAVAEGFSRILVLGGLGGRIDHTLANLSLLLRGDLRTRDVRFDDGREEALMVFRNAELNGSPGDTVSLLPFGNDVSGITTEGLEFPLREETLFADRTRGVSNRLTGTCAAILIREGCLLCIHTRR